MLSLVTPAETCLFVYKMTSAVLNPQDACYIYKCDRCISMILQYAEQDQIKTVLHLDRIPSHAQLTQKIKRFLYWSDKSIRIQTSAGCLENDYQTLQI